MAPKSDTQTECHCSDNSTMAAVQLVFTLLSFIVTLANLPFIILAYKKLIRNK